MADMFLAQANAADSMLKGHILAGLAILCIVLALAISFYVDRRKRRREQQDDSNT